MQKQFGSSSSCKYRNLSYSVDHQSSEEEQDLLLELTRQMSYSTVENIICLKPTTTTTTSYPISSHKTYRGQGKINHPKPRGPKQQMKQQQQHVRIQQRQDAEANWRYRLHHLHGSYGIRSESAGGTGVFLPRHHPDITPRCTNVDIRFGGQSNTSTYVLSQQQKFHNLDDESRVTHHDIRLPEEWTY